MLTSIGIPSVSANLIIAFSISASSLGVDFVEDELAFVEPPVINKKLQRGYTEYPLLHIF
mgnify:CR=1 FL=1